MSRYLTPSKIGLLTLISLYTESVVPSGATVAILSFLVSHLLPANSTVSNLRLGLHQQETVLDIDDFQRATISHISGIPGRTVWDLLLHKLWRIESFDALHVFFDTLSTLVQKAPEDRETAAAVDPNPHRMLLARTSPLGTFVRRTQLEFTRLPFHDALLLWKSFVAYRASTLLQWKKRNPTAGDTSFDANLRDDHLTWEDPLTSLVYGNVERGSSQRATVSTEDVEKFLDFQVDRMQRMGNRLPQEMKGKLREMLEAGATVPSLSHYVAFLDAWKAGDYPSSFDNLHRYFDYTMHNRDRTFYQYALLNLAILHADFGCHSEAVTAMQETISTARENHDTGCLNYSLSWLYHFGKAHPDEMTKASKGGVLGNEKEALSFLKAKAKETNMWSLLSTSLLSEAKLTLSNVKKTSSYSLESVKNPAKGEGISQAFESIMKASHLNVTKSAVNVVGSQMSMHSAIFGRIGVNCQAWLSGELFLQCYAKHSPVEDVIHCVCRSSFLLSQRGRYEDAIVRMEEIGEENLRTLRYYQYWTAQVGLLKLRRYLHQGNIIAAENVLTQLRTPLNLSQELNFSVSILEIELQILHQDYPKAMELLEGLATRLNEEDGDIYQRVKLMTLKARIYDKAGVPQKGFSIALRAATIAHRVRLLPILWEAVGAMCAVLNSLAEFCAATRLMESIMPQVLECEDCDLAARSFSLLADSHMGTAGQSIAGSIQRKEQLTKALENIDKSFDEFSRIEEVKGQCEMMAKKSTIMHMNGDPVLANDCAAKCLDIRAAAAARKEGLE
ncbi:APC5 protein [Lecanora helva]